MICPMPQSSENSILSYLTDIIQMVVHFHSRLMWFIVEIRSWSGCFFPFWNCNLQVFVLRTIAVNSPTYLGKPVIQNVAEMTDVPRGTRHTECSWDDWAAEGPCWREFADCEAARTCNRCTGPCSPLELQSSWIPATAHTHTHTRLTALFRDYPGEPVPER